MATPDESFVTENWPILCTFLPQGWKEMARSTGAFRRARDIPDAESLLRLLLMHVANGYSLAETAVRAKHLGMNLSAVAVFKRLRASEEWLRWLAEQERGTQPLAIESQGRPVRAVDATTISEPGSTGTDWRVHYVVNLANLQCDFFELTDVKGGETLRRIPVRPGDIILGDRIYATPFGVAHVKAAQADMVVRLNRQSLPIFDAAGNQLNVPQLFRKMKVGQTQQWTTQVKHPSGGGVSGRLIALKRSAEATRLARRRLERNASRKQKKVSAESWKAAQYFFVWTTLADRFPAPAVLELYRLRWQIGVSRQGHIVQSVRDRPRLKDSGLVAGEAPWRESKTAEPSDNILRKECTQRTRLQRAVNADVASLHEIPVAETVDNARKQQELAETSPMRQLSPAGYQRRHGVKDDVETGEALGARRRNLVEEMPAITVSGKCWHRHQGGGSGCNTVDGRAAKRARREGPGPVSIPSVKGRQG